MDHIKYMGPDISSVVFQLPLETLRGITRLDVFLLCQHCSISCSAECPSEPIYYRKDYLSIFDIRINQSYFDNSVKLEYREWNFYLILKLILLFFYFNDLFGMLYICTVHIFYTCILYMYSIHVLHAYYVYIVYVYSVYSICIVYTVCTVYTVYCMHAYLQYT